MKKYFIFLITILSIFITRAYAYVDNTKSYIYDYSNFDENFSLVQFSNNVSTFREFFTELNSIEQNTYKLSYFFFKKDSNWRILVLLFDNSLSSANFNSYYSSTAFNLEIGLTSSYYVQFINNYSLSTNQDNFNNLKSCLLNNDCSSLRSANSSISLSFNRFSSGDYSISPNYIYGCLYYSDIPLYLILPDNASSSSNYYYNVYVDDTFVDYNSEFPTYIVDGVPDVPDEPEYIGNTIDNYVYWFYERDDEIGVLVNLYILLFFYCFISLTLKFLKIIKHTYY